MTKDDIIRMALDSYGAMTGTGSILFTLNGSLVRFAELLEAKVRADEREACAHIVEDWDLECFNYLACPRVVADAIRARGEK